MNTKFLNILFIHPNFPGQFKELLLSLRKHDNVKLAFITSNDKAEMEGVEISMYKQPERRVKDVHRYLRNVNQEISGAQEITKLAIGLKSKDFIPNVIVGHIGWSGTVLMKDAFPEAKLIGYCEWYFKWQNSWENFSGQNVDMDKKASIRFLNTSSILSLETLDVSVTPTHWQRSVFPKIHQRKMRVIHEGIDTNVCKPNIRSDIRIPGCRLDKNAKIITYVSRSMEPARGFFTFMSATEKLGKQYSDLQFIIVGRERSAYSNSTGDGPSYKEQALEKYDCDWSRVHFTGKLKYEDYLTVLQNSSVHVHLSMPLFMSWSLLEAMSCSCTIVGSANAPVNESNSGWC